MSLADARAAEAGAVRDAEAGELQSALDALTAVVEARPRYASAYNNRAQVHRLMGHDADAMVDLTKAIELALEGV